MEEKEAYMRAEGVWATWMITVALANVKCAIDVKCAVNVKVKRAVKVKVKRAVKVKLAIE